MSRYDEEAKETVGEAVKEWLVENYRFRSSEVDVYTHPDHEAYVTVEIDYDHDADGWYGFNSERVRQVVKERTDERVDSIPTSDDHSVTIVPDGVRD